MLKDFGLKLAGMSLGFVVRHFAKLVCFVAGVAAGVLWF